MKPISTFLVIFGLASFSLGPSAQDEPPEWVIHSIGVTYPNPDDTEFLKDVLKSMNRSFEVVEENGAVTVYWKPENKSQEQEVSNRVSQYSFVRDVCKGLPLPLPSQPAKEALSC